MSKCILITLSTILLFFISTLALPSSVFAIETFVKDFGLSPTKPYLDTGVDIRIGDILNFRHQSGQITIQGSSYRWLASMGDPTCIADSEYTLPGYNCWSFVGRIGTAPPFFAATNILGGLKTIYALNSGRLYLGINHKLPLLGYGGWSIRLIKNYYPPPAPPAPFLDLPWDYQSKGKSFSDAALGMNSYFDHQYPLLSTSLIEPGDSYKNVTTFKGNSSVLGIYYTKHDGYDYGRSTGAHLNTPIIAPADGCASYTYNNAVGNAIYLDHHNNYQTRYYHLQPDGLVTTSSTGCVEVTKGQQIGLVGSTGNSTGPHLHFMVVEDKNRDGNFGDNIPDGVTDPFGWQSSDPDPWENYQFSYNGSERIGNKSNYLWLHTIPNLNPTLKTNSAYFEFEKTRIEFGSNSVKEETQLKLSKAPWFKVSEIIHSLRSSLQIKANNLFGAPVTQFLKPFTLTFDTSNLDLTRYKPETLKIYSSSNGQDWTAEETVVDWQNQTAKTQISHLTYFTLAAELADTTSPETIVSANIEPVVDNTFAEPVEISLIPEDGANSVGIDFTLYKVGVSDWAEYSEPLSFTGDDEYRVQFYSGDLNENIEPAKTYDFKIDSSLAFTPELVLNINQSSFIPEFLASPSGQITNTLISGHNWQSQTKNGIKTLTAKYTHTQKNDIFRYEFFNLLYNLDPIINLPANRLQINIHKDKSGEIQNMQQILSLNNQTIFTGYISKQNKTQFIDMSLDPNSTHQTLSGLYTLQLFTDKGKLNYQLTPTN